MSSFYYNFFFSIFVERSLVSLLISLSYCEYVTSSAITNIPFYYIEVTLGTLERYGFGRNLVIHKIPGKSTFLTYY
jgi:hypothetical protein